VALPLVLLAMSSREGFAQGQQAVSIRITAVAPTTIQAGSSALDLTVAGTGFTTKSQVRIRGDHRSTVFVSTTRLRAKLFQEDVAAAGSAPITVFTPGSGSSNVLALSIAAVPAATPVAPPAPAPTMSISALEPASAIPGAWSFSLGVRGAGFTNGMIIRWNNGAKVTSFLVSSLLHTDIGAVNVASPGQASVTVFDPATGAETPPFAFYIDAARSGVPSIRSISKTTGVAGTIIEFAINGDGFVAGSAVRLNGTAAPATSVSLNGSRIIGVRFPTTMTAVPGIYRVTVFNAGSNGGESNAAILTLAAQ